MLQLGFADSLRLSWSALGWQVAVTKKYVRREVINHSSLTHPHIVKFRECFLTDKYLAIAMEYAAGGDMFKYVSHKCACTTVLGFACRVQ